MQVFRGFKFVATLAFLGLVSLACAMHPVAVDTLNPTFPEPMVARKAQIPTVIIMRDVPDAMEVTGPDTKPIQVTGVQSFVRKDVKRALEQYYQTVTVVNEGDPLPTDPHLEVPVKVANLEMVVDKATANGVTAYQIRGAITWSIAMLKPGEQEYSYTFSDKAVGSVVLTTVNETDAMIESTFSVALTRFLKDYAASGAHKIINPS